MRLRLDFQETLVQAPLRKSWISVPAHFHLISDLYAYIVKSFGLNISEEHLQLTLDDHYLPRNQRLFDIIKDSDLILVSGTGQREVKTPCPAPKPSAAPKIKRREETSSSDSEEMPVVPLKRRSEKGEKDQDKRKNPKLAEFKGTHIKFDKEGGTHEVQDKPVVDLRLKTPSQEFDERKATWKSKPFPKKRPTPSLHIQEKYEFSESDFTPADPSTLTAGQEVLFKTLELSEQMIPVVSPFKVTFT